MFRELVVRWFAYAVFCPILRLHGFRVAKAPTVPGVGGPNEIWSFGGEVYEILRGYIFLRERLRPYLMPKPGTLAGPACR
jgi:alpha-D-xyloside xylohydrolase